MPDRDGQASGNIHNVHVLRGMAALMVVVFHAKFVFWSGGAKYVSDIGLHSFYDRFIFFLDMMSSCGRQCVLIFFILSAFFIQYSAGKNNYKWRDFYIIRIVRIYYPFLFAVVFGGIVLFCCVRFINPDFLLYPRDFNHQMEIGYSELWSSNIFLRTVFFVGNGDYYAGNAVYWSLTHEMIFYFLFPVYYRYFKSDWSMIAAMSFFTGLFILNRSDIAYFQIFFPIGILLLRHFERILKGWSKLPGITRLFIILILYVAMNLVVKVGVIGEVSADIIAVLLSIVVMASLIIYRSKINRFFIKMGEVSYSLYLFHFPLLVLLYAIVSKLTGNYFFYSRIYYLAVLIIIPVNFLLFYFFERPSLKLINFIKKKLRPRPVEIDRPSFSDGKFSQ